MTSATGKQGVRRAAGPARPDACHLYVRAQLDPAGLSWTQRDLARPKSNSPRAAIRAGHGPFPLVVTGARFELAEAEPTVLQNAHSYPSEWPLTCYLSILRRVKPAFCPPRVREFRVAQVSAPRPGKPVPLSPAESRCVSFCRRLVRPRGSGPPVLRPSSGQLLKSA